MKRVLCVDDDQDILDIYEIVLSAEGYSVKTSIYPVDILQLILDFDPNLIILDIKMDAFNGLEVCKEVKSYISNKDTPVIIISSDDSIHTAVCDFGATGIILKPFEIDKLVKTINFHLFRPIVLSPEIILLFTR